MLPLGFRHVVHGAGTSGYTGDPVLVQDYSRIAISIQTSTTSASLFTVQGSNDDGLQSALGTPSHATGQNGWSIITALSGFGLWNFDPGALGQRWLRVFRPDFTASAGSNATVTITGSW